MKQKRAKEGGKNPSNPRIGTTGFPMSSRAALQNYYRYISKATKKRKETKPSVATTPIVSIGN